MTADSFAGRVESQDEVSEFAVHHKSTRPTTQPTHAHVAASSSLGRECYFTIYNCLVFPSVLFSTYFYLRGILRGFVAAYHQLSKCRCCLQFLSCYPHASPQTRHLLQSNDTLLQPLYERTPGIAFSKGKRSMQGYDSEAVEG